MLVRVKDNPESYDVISIGCNLTGRKICQSGNKRAWTVHIKDKIFWLLIFYRKRLKNEVISVLFWVASFSTWERA